MPLPFALSLSVASPAVCVALLFIALAIVIKAMTAFATIESDVQLLENVYSSGVLPAPVPPAFNPTGISAVQFSQQLALLCQSRGVTPTIIQSTPMQNTNDRQQISTPSRV